MTKMRLSGDKKVLPLITESAENWKSEQSKAGNIVVIDHDNGKEVNETYTAYGKDDCIVSVAGIRTRNQGAELTYHFYAVDLSYEGI
ncbi:MULTISPECIES: hypothetical protein [Vibrio]|uniref:hypothetical protein n=1 Tax=Vibrio TaxID=662 RepID=UPI0020757DA2|nr:MULTISPECIES: hypothetical protein [Vibrio]USD35549.1 hypothetical protein J8Z27_22315 [Vibrio sp. SCSIO 43186]USD72673.1 hypothetical protein J4N41_22330 [Vibrio sp. SCSIO 43139]USD98887.1 hypothetical protein CTT30_22660 [Vibrio coralliilyticus]